MAKYADVQRSQKRVHYTITPIEDLKAWKAERRRIDEEYSLAAAKRYEERRKNTIAVLEGSRRQEFTLTEVQEMAYRGTVSKAVVDYAQDKPGLPPCVSIPSYEPKPLSFFRKCWNTLKIFLFK